MGTANPTACTFCRIVDGTIPAVIVWEGKHHMAFLDVEPASPGHTLVVPKGHSPSLLHVTPVAVGDLFEAVAHVTRVLQDTHAPDGFSIVQSNGAAAWQDIFHTHVHVVPRWHGDALVRPWGGEPLVVSA